MTTGLQALLQKHPTQPSERTCTVHRDGLVAQHFSKPHPAIQIGCHASMRRPQVTSKPHRPGFIATGNRYASAPMCKLAGHNGTKSSIAAEEHDAALMGWIHLVSRTIRVIRAIRGSQFEL